MIHQLFPLTRPLFVIDTETTGTDVKNDRILWFAFQQWTAEGMTKEWQSLVNPLVPIPSGASKVHGITDETFRRCRVCERTAEEHRQPPAGTIGEPTRHCEGFRPWPTFKQLASSLARGLSGCDFAGKRVRFDLRITAAEMQRNGQPWDYSDAAIIDADRLEQLLVPRELSDLYLKYTGEKMDGAHDPMVDVKGVTSVIVEQIKTSRGMTTHPCARQLPTTLKELHELQWPGWLCDGGEFRMVHGVPTCQFGKWRGRAMKDIERSYWDWILTQDFPADVKRLAADAKMGKFPEAR